LQSLLHDVLNAFGWNSGLRKPYKSFSREAWWYAVPPTGAAMVFESFSQTFQTDLEIGNLFNMVRAGTQAKGIPCKDHPGDPKHRYQVHERTPFRVRCSNNACRHKLQRAALAHGIAQLVTEGVVDRRMIVG